MVSRLFHEILSKEGPQKKKKKKKEALLYLRTTMAKIWTPHLEFLSGVVGGLYCEGWCLQHGRGQGTATFGY